MSSVKKKNGAGKRFLSGLMLAATIFLSSCAKTCFDYMPQWPVAGPDVAAELESLPYEGYEDFWEWLARLNKTREIIQTAES